MPYFFSEQLDDELLYERVDSARRGMDAFSRPIYLSPDASVLIENMIPGDNNLVQIRPGADALGGEASGANIIQGLSYFDTIGGTEQVCMIRNRDFEYWDGVTWTAPAAGVNIASAATDMVEFAQLDDKLFFTDGSGVWNYWDGSAFTALGSATSATGDAPNGASIVVNHTYRLFASGDAAKPDTIWVSDVGDATNGAWDHTAWSFRVGRGEGEAITAMAPLHGFWLSVFKENSIYLVNADPSEASAAAWTVSLLTRHIGCVGKRAWCRFGNDVLFVARDGIRSLGRMSARDAYEVVDPLSEPMQPYIDRINWTYASTICAWKYKQFAFFALPLDDATSPDHVLVWNGRLGHWAGVIAGWTPTCFVTSRFSSVERFLHGASDGRVNEWKDFADEALDATYQDNGTDVAWKFRPRSMVFGEPVSEKFGFFVEARFVDSNGTVTLTVYYDEAQKASWTESVQLPGVTLPVTMPFFLPEDVQATIRRNLSSKGRFNEMYFELSGSGKRVKIKNATVAAFLGTVLNQ